MVREAHEHQEYQSSSTENETPFTMDHSFFLGEDEGQLDDDNEHHQVQSSDEQEDVESRSPTPPSDDPLESQSETESGSEARSDYSDTDAPF
jgi:galactose mutarotase-like enzyme